jgi:hypothetical protein
MNNHPREAVILARVLLGLFAIFGIALFPPLLPILLVVFIAYVALDL